MKEPKYKIGQKLIYLDWLWLNKEGKAYGHPKLACGFVDTIKIWDRKEKNGGPTFLYEFDCDHGEYASDDDKYETRTEEQLYPDVQSLIPLLQKWYDDKKEVKP